MADVKWAVQHGEVDKLREMDFNVKETVQGRTLLHIAADYGQLDVIEYLVETKNADVNAKDNYGISVLLMAIYGSEGQERPERYKKCITYLLSKNAEKTGTGPDGKSYEDSTDNEEIKQLLR